MRRNAPKTQVKKLLPTQNRDNIKQRQLKPSQSRKHISLAKSNPKTTLSSKLFSLSPSQRKLLFECTFAPRSQISRSLSTSAIESSENNANLDTSPQYDEKAPHRKKPKQAHILADGDSIMKVFGNPADEDPSEPIIRSILPNGIVRATGIENPRLGSYITIHLSGGQLDGGDPFEDDTNRLRIQAMKQNKDVNSSMQPTIKPVGNKVQAEIIRITKHEIFLALPCSPHLVNVEDRVSKTKDKVPGFRVPVTITRGRLVAGSIPDEELNELEFSLNDGSMQQEIAPLFGSVLNAFGDPIEQVSKQVMLGDDDLEERVNFDFNSNQVITVPHSNRVANHVLKRRLKQLPYILGMHGPGFKKQLNQRQLGNQTENPELPYQQLYQSFDESATYKTQIDVSDSDDDFTDMDNPDGPTNEEIQEIKNDPFLSLPLKRAKLAAILQKNHKYITNIELPTRYRANNSAQLLTGIPAIDMLNPIRKGSRTLFTSADTNDLTQFGQTVFKNTLQQALADKSNLPTNGKSINPDITPKIDADMIGLEILKENNDGKLIPENLLNLNTVGIYCALGKTAHAKSSLVSQLRPVLDNSLIIYTNENDTPYTHSQAVKQAIGMSNALRLQGKDVVVVIDDLRQHANAILKMNESFNLALGSGVTGNHHVVNSTHANLFDSIGVISVPPTHEHLKRQKVRKNGLQSGLSDADNPNDPTSDPNNTLYDTDRETFGSSTMISLYTTFPENAQPSLQLRQSEQILDGLKSIVDRTIPFHTHLQASKLWPPLEVQPLHPVLPTVSPILRNLLQHLNSRIIESQHLFEYAQVSESLGISLDFDVNEVIEWKAKVQALLMQNNSKQYTLAEQYLFMFSAGQDRILAGIDFVQVPTFKRYLLKNVTKKYPTIFKILENIVNVSTELPVRGYKRKFVNPASLYNSDGQITDEKGRILSQSDQILDSKTKELLAKQTFQPYLSQTGAAISPIDEFICHYVYKFINIKALDDFTSPLFLLNQDGSASSSTGSAGSAGSSGNQRPQHILPLDHKEIQLLNEKLQNKFNQVGPYQHLQSAGQQATFESMYKANTVGKYGLPIVLDELLQIIVDDAHEEFLMGKWKLDGDFVAIDTTVDKWGSTGIPSANEETAQSSDQIFAVPTVGHDVMTITTTDGVRIESNHVSQLGFDVFDSTKLSVDLPTRPSPKAKDHPLNIGLGKALGLSDVNPEAALEHQAPVVGKKGWFGGLF
jgi:hypothetical protein